MKSCSVLQTILKETVKQHLLMKQSCCFAKALGICLITAKSL